MKKIVVLFLSLVTILSYSGQVLGQEKTKTEIASVKQKGETVRFTLASSKPFIAGGNRYILHIGSKDFFRYEQSVEDDKNTITFFIPVSDFNGLENGESIYLTYGTVKKGTQMEELAKRSHRCWSEGKFRKTLLTK